jgi:short subunit dehydrogenase-like uncharacterized protein
MTSIKNTQTASRPLRSWMLYGATGYTGRLMLEEAVRRGHEPIVAGRNEAAVRELALRFRLPWRAFALEDHKATCEAIRGTALVLHCAGPFSATCAPMLEACLQEQAHYLDITGEMSVFAHCHMQDARARRAGIVVVPGTGFDVVPTDCLAALLKARLPDARSLVLAFEAGGGASPGTTKTGIEGLARGGRVRRNGDIVAVPLAWKTRTFLRDGKPRSAMTIPWGDVYTAYVSTDIPDIEVYLGASPAAIRGARRLRFLRPMLALGPMQRLLKARAGRAVRGPDADRRARSGCHVWGEVRSASGHELKLELDTPNGYDVTVWCALGIAEHLLSGAEAVGFRTPSQLMGSRFILQMPGVVLKEAT